MARPLSVDTSFLIDLQRERSRGEDDGPAHTFIATRREVELQLSSVALGEFAEGFADRDAPILRAVREGLVLQPIDEETALIYGRITRSLRASGQLIGGNDLWIAASSLRHGLPLVTGDTAAFLRVEGLEVVGYR